MVLVLERWSKVKVPQPISIQLLFDLKFIGLATGSSLDPTYAQIEQQIEKMVSNKVFS